MGVTEAIQVWIKLIHRYKRRPSRYFNGKGTRGPARGVYVEYISRTMHTRSVQMSHEMNSRTSFQLYNTKAPNTQTLVGLVQIAFSRKSKNDTLFQFVNSRTQKFSALQITDFLSIFWCVKTMVVLLQNYYL